MKRRILWFLIVALCLPALACNFPGRVRPGTPLTGKQLKQTLQAQSQASVEPKAPAEVKGPTQEVIPGTVQAPGAIPPLINTPGASPLTPEGYFSYFAQPGDTLPALERRFQLSPGQIASDQPIPSASYIPLGQQLWIPNLVEEAPDTGVLLPDSEVINSPSSLDFDIDEFIRQAGGFLSTYQEMVYGEPYSGADIIRRVSQESSVNPRILLALLEFRAGWVFNPSSTQADTDHPLGFNVPGYTGLFQEIVMAATHLNAGYYGWRSGERITLKYSDGAIGPINPRLNAGSVAVQNLLAKFFKHRDWFNALYGSNNFIDLYQERFGDPWARAALVEPLLTPSVLQPALELPFVPGKRWSYSGGPHFTWSSGSPLGAIDFSPVTGEKACAPSSAWVLASAPGMVTRSAYNVVAIDLDGDGFEQTGWVLVYLHIANRERISPGQYVQADTRLGHPSCERGQATGTNVHIARKYNGEWLPAEGPLPFILGGYVVSAGEKIYQGSLVSSRQQVIASPYGRRTSIIVR